MEIIVEPSRFQKMLNSVLIGGQLSSVTAIFLKDGVHIEDNSQIYIGVKAFYAKEFFIGYKIEGEEEKISLSDRMLKPFGFHEAFEEEKIKILTKGNKIFYEAIDKDDKSTEFWEDILEDPTEHKIAIPVPMGDKGFIPTGRVEAIQVLLRIGQLKVHSSEKYKFISDGKKLDIQVEDPGIYKRKLNLTEETKLSEYEQNFVGEALEKIISLFVGEVWVTLYDLAAVFSQKTKKKSLTYILSPQPDTD